MAYIGKVNSPVKYTSKKLDTMTGDGSDTTLTLTDTPMNVCIYIDGVFQKPDVEYTISGNVVTFTTAPGVGCKVVALYGGGETIAAPAAGSVTTDDIVDNAITAAKIVSLDAAKLTGNLPAMDGSALTNITSLGEMTKSSSDPTHTTNPSGGVGTVWVNNSDGKMYICTDATTNANIWKNVGDGGGGAGGGGSEPAHYTASFLVIAGGGGGGKGQHAGGGGGGAGGYRSSWNNETSGGGAAAESPVKLYTGQVYTVTVGGGAAGSSSFSVVGGTGSDSSITSTGNSHQGTDVIVCKGGGGGDSYSNTSSLGQDGGCGGGGGQSNYPGGLGTIGQGYDGGDQTLVWSGAGGGGTGAQGSDSVGANSAGGPGGAGQTSSITGSSVQRGGGGGGSIDSGGGAGGAGGGGNATGGGTGGSGSANTGSGGGGAGGTGGAGGSGLVVLRMSSTNYTGTVSGSQSVSTSGGDTIITFTGDGSYTA